jgi:hypothetical protein
LPRAGEPWIADKLRTARFGLQMASVRSRVAVAARLRA